MWRLMSIPGSRDKRTPYQRVETEGGRGKGLQRNFNQAALRARVGGRVGAFVSCRHVRICLCVCVCMHVCVRLQFRGKLHIRVPLPDLVTLESKASASLPATAMLPRLRAIDILPIAGTIKHRLVTLAFRLRARAKEFRRREIVNSRRENCVKIHAYRSYICVFFPLIKLFCRVFNSTVRNNVRSWKS